MILSIIIPTWNREDLLVACSESALARLDLEVEVIIADDGSTDGTPRICQELQKAYGARRVSISRSEEHLGAQAARNRGFSLARGKLVMFLDSDDVVIPAGVMRLVECLHEDATLNYAYGKVIRTDEHLTPLPSNSAVGEAFSKAPIEVAGYHWHTMGAIYRRNYLVEVGPWNDALTGSQDWEYQARVKLAGGRGEFVDTIVGFWRQHASSRVGAKSFRPDYVRSVMVACESILRQARKAGRCDRALERRLARNLIIHALEWGANGHAHERRRCLLQAGRSLPDDGLYKAVIRCFEFSPIFLDSWMWKSLSKHK